MMQNELGFKLFDAALEGARTLMSFWCGVTIASTKADGSLVSEADHAADRSVRKSLAKLGIGTALVSEESVGAADMGHETFLLLDPLDGTNDFLEHGEEFCVCLAAIHQGRAVAGAIVAPAIRRAWFAGETSFAVALGDNLEPVGKPEHIHISDRVRHTHPNALVSRRNGDPRSVAALERCGVASMVPASSAIKFGMLAEGRADIHIRHGQTMAWDIAAGDAILTAAGGHVRSISGMPLSYSGAEHGFRNPPFVAVSSTELLAPVLSAVQRAS
ncbi:MAG: 3'(2'),5'-bisphosphate nucleotidase CysQ family protein [Bosea sp. (in: a-proteobacteria)]